MRVGFTFNDRVFFSDPKINHWTNGSDRSENRVGNDGGLEMLTTQQSNGRYAQSVVRLRCECVGCQTRSWKTMRGDQDGIDLQCTECGRFAQAKGIYCGERVRPHPRQIIPSAGFAAWERLQQQNIPVDLYVVCWDAHHNYMVIVIPADTQPVGFVTARPILTGPRAGYVMSDINLGMLPLAARRVISEGNLRTKSPRRAPHGFRKEAVSVPDTRNLPRTSKATADPLSLKRRGPASRGACVASSKSIAGQKRRLT
jgi:hypothetical protein